MKLLSLGAVNFASYPTLAFNFNGLGLTLVHGPTGAGKSTVMDASSWCLYGATAKAGAADDIRPWNNLNELTAATIEVETNDGTRILVTRIRGLKNDLFWTEQELPSEKIRGKDLKDTQARLEARLAVTADQYLQSAYFHEYSLSGTFFMAKAKARRDMFEQLSDSALSTRLLGRIADGVAEATRSLRSLSYEHTLASDRVRGLSEQLTRLRDAFEQSEIDRCIKVRQLKKEAESFEEGKATKIEKIKAQSEEWEKGREQRKQSALKQAEQSKLDAAGLPAAKVYRATLAGKATALKELRCGECGAPKNHEDLEEVLDLIDQTNTDIRRFERALEEYHRSSAEALKEIEAKNPYLEQTINQLDNCQNGNLQEVAEAPNPYAGMIDNTQLSLDNCEEAEYQLRLQILSLEHDKANLEQLQELTLAMRASLLQNTISTIESATNDRLQKYFDGIFRVSFTLTGVDDLDVGITKDGNNCVYKQLSKGQKQVLKLCFATSIMEVTANKAGTHFDTLMFDEALDGLDGELKVKAFALLQDLAAKHGTVLVIDHSEELKSCFSSKFRVTIDGDESCIEEDNE